MTSHPAKVSRIRFKRRSRYRAAQAFDIKTTMLIRASAEMKARGQ